MLAMVSVFGKEGRKENAESPFPQPKNTSARRYKQFQNNGWEPQESLVDCAHALEEFRDNSSLKRVETNGTRYYEGHSKWLKEKRISFSVHVYERALTIKQ
ncbi:hypothetical protein PM082_009957 [Marasmius tenuissimus]|nr:hypothetical protein PM082_009957 [Marasmius tenuissimus]